MTQSPSRRRLVPGCRRASRAPGPRPGGGWCRGRSGYVGQSWPAAGRSRRRNASRRAVGFRPHFLLSRRQHGPAHARQLVCPVTVIGESCRPVVVLVSVHLEDDLLVRPCVIDPGDEPSSVSDLQLRSGCGQSGSEQHAEDLCLEVTFERPGQPRLQRRSDRRRARPSVVTRTAQRREEERHSRLAAQDAVIHQPLDLCRPQPSCKVDDRAIHRRHR